MELFSEEDSTESVRNSTFDTLIIRTVLVQTFNCYTCTYM